MGYAKIVFFCWVLSVFFIYFALMQSIKNQDFRYFTHKTAFIS